MVELSQRCVNRDNTLKNIGGRPRRVQRARVSPYIALWG
jgi:hypothetical protein